MELTHIMQLSLPFQKKQTQVIKWLVFGFCVVFTIFEV